MKFEALILDFDGTIGDTRRSIIETTKETFNYLNLPNYDEEEVRKRIGVPLKVVFEDLACLKGEALENAVNEYRSRYEEVAKRTAALFPEVKSTLETFYNKGVKLAIASSRGRGSLGMLLKHLEIETLFSFMLGEQDVKVSKPAPDIVLLAIDKLKVPMEKSLVIGDTIFDIGMGKNAGCPTCAVTYGNGTYEELSAAKPDYIIDKFSDLLKIAEE